MNMKTMALISSVFFVLLSAGCGVTSRIPIHERFRTDENNVITDIVTGLQWMVGPDRDFGWYEANIWLRDLEGDWRMPTRDELEQLFAAGITTDTWGPFDNSGWIVWCVDYSSPNMAHRFCFLPNVVFMGAFPPVPSGERVFTVMSPAGYSIVAAGVLSPYFF